LFERSLNLIATGRLKLDSLLTHRFKLAEIETAIKVAEQGSAIKVVIN
jgi:L-iditol 2-dehydrogenase